VFVHDEVTLTNNTGHDVAFSIEPFHSTIYLIDFSTTAGIIPKGKRVQVRVRFIIVYPIAINTILTIKFNGMFSAAIGLLHQILSIIVQQGGLPSK
jgi:hypothetical protein